ncbi:MAG: DUF3891 family protein, partial [Actinomycetota bacterium]
EAARMIVQRQSGDLLLFKQTDHALLSGEFCLAWGNDDIPAPARPESTQVAAARHDDGWAEWELAPKLRADGDPVDFIRVPVSDHVPLYKRGIDLVTEENDYAGLLASLHGQRLYTRPFHPGMDPRIEHLQGDDLALARAYVDGEHERQERLIGKLGEDVRPIADEGWRLLQVWDRLSLLVCMNEVKSGVEVALPAIASARDGDVQLVARATDEGDVIVDPFPFNASPVSFDIAYVRTNRTTWDSEADYRKSFRTGAHEVLRFSCTSSW